MGKYRNEKIETAYQRRRKEGRKEGEGEYSRGEMKRINHENKSFLILIKSPRNRLEKLSQTCTRA